MQWTIHNDENAAPSAANIRNGAKGVARKFGTDLANGTAVPAAVSHAPALTARARSALGPRTTESDSLVSRFEGLLGGHTAPAVPILDIDAADRDQPNNVVEYIKDIYEHLRQFEVKYQPSANYMASQTDITDRMRAILVDWLIDVHLKFKLRHETVRKVFHHCCIQNYMYKYIQRFVNVFRYKYQFVFNYSTNKKNSRIDCFNIAKIFFL